MPQKIEQLEFEEHSQERELTKEGEALQELIDAGDHLAMIMRRVVAGLHTPKLTLNNAIDQWEQTVEPLER